MTLGEKLKKARINKPCRSTERFPENLFQF